MRVTVVNRLFTTVVLGVLVGCRGVSRDTHRAFGDAGETGGSGNRGGETTGTGGGGEGGRDASDCTVGAEICPTWAPYCICPDETCTNPFCGTCGAEFVNKFEVCATERDACLEDPSCEGCLGAGGADCYEGGEWAAYMFCACANIQMTEHPGLLECCYGWCYSEGLECRTSDTGTQCCPGLTCRDGRCAL